MKKSLYLMIVMLLFAGYGNANNGYPIDKIHAEQGVTCSDCHLTDKPEKKAKIKECLQCHESYQAVAERTSELEPNPHASHQGELRCNLCHKIHSEDTLYCNQCHGFTQFKLK